jgi:hypothetical protein
MFGKKKNEFSFEDEVATSGNESPQEEAHFTQQPTGRKASSSRTLLLLLLLLAVAGGGGYFVMMNEPEPPPAPQPVVQRQAIPIARPQAAPATPAEPATAVTSAGEVAAVVAEPAPATDAPAPAAQVAAAPPGPAEVPVSSAVAPTVPAEQPPVTAAVAVQPPPSVLPAVAREPVKAPAPVAGKFTLVSLLYADQGNVTTVQQGARKLGFQPTVTTVTRDATMTRLRYGTFRPEEAPARLQELKKVAPAAFTLRQGELVSVYAGSFAVQEKARAFADLLYQQQILVEEEVVQVKVPLQQVSFGSFADRSAADKAAARARAAGMVVTIQARR